jgi:hypothetical protein
MKRQILHVALCSAALAGGLSPVFGDDTTDTTAPSTPAAPVPVSVTVDTSTLGTVIADDYAGLSYETKRMLPDPDYTGSYYFRDDNTALIKMFQTLGVKNLRVGGNSVDGLKVSIPQQADIDSLFKFAKAAGAKVIYSFRLRNGGDPKGTADQAKYIEDNYADSLACFSIGNEDDVYIHSYGELKKDYQPIYDAVNDAVPNAKYCGPGLTSNGVPWAHDFADDYWPSGKFIYIAQHEYAGGAGGKVTDPVAGRDEMLSPAWQDKYKEYNEKFGAPLLAKGIPWRLEEANNFYNGGAKDVSDSLAAALWGLDYLYWYAAHGGQGINFHNGDQVAAGQDMTAPCNYASFVTAPDGYAAHPLAYGIKMFNLGSKGQMVSTTVEPDPSAADLNLVSYAVLGSDKALYVTIINKEHDDKGRDADVTIKAGNGFTQGQTIALTAPNNDVAAKDGLTLGADSIHDDGTWQEKWTPLATPPAAGQVDVKVPKTSVLLVKLTGS